VGEGSIEDRGTGRETDVVIFGKRRRVWVCGGVWGVVTTLVDGVVVTTGMLAPSVVRGADLVGYVLQDHSAIGTYIQS
jgi:hypothetical protein